MTYLKTKVAAKVLRDIRRDRRDPNWRPTGLFNGGWEVGLKTRWRMKRLQARFEREEARRGAMR